VTVPPALSVMFEHVLALEGRTVLYIEKMNLFRIVVTEVRPRDDGQGFECLATFVPTRGMACKHETWRFGAGWDYFHATPTTVHCTYGGWRIYAEKAVMDEVLQLLKDLPEGRSYFSDYKWTPVDGSPMVTARGTPGHIAKRVHEFLRNL
jgi:hypothetical protein